MYISDRKNYQKSIINILKNASMFSTNYGSNTCFSEVHIFEILMDLYQFTRIIFDKSSLNADYDSTILFSHQ